MNPLKESIKHWEELLEIALRELGKPISYYGPDEWKFGSSLFQMGSRHCALCGEYFMFDCRVCPVRLRTGQSECYASPYRVLADYLRFSPPIKDVDGTICRLIQDEVEFLKSLEVKRVKRTTGRLAKKPARKGDKSLGKKAGNSKKREG